MWVIKPVAIDLGYSNIPDSTAVEWNKDATYAIDAVVKVTVAGQPTHTFQSLISGNKGNAPATSPGSWKDLGVTNRDAMFDSTVATQTTSDGDIVVELGSESIDTLVLVGVVANSIRIEQMYCGNKVMDETHAMALFDETKSIDWYSYFFSCVTFRSVLVANVLPVPYSTLRVTITPLSGTAACGVLSAGTKTQVGDVQWGAMLGFTDYSKVEFDDFGRPYLAPGAWANKVSGTCYFDNTLINTIAALRASLRATPAMYNLDDRDGVIEPLLLFGVFRTFDIVIQGPTESLCNYEIQGFI